MITNIKTQNLDDANKILFDIKKFLLELKNLGKKENNITFLDEDSWIETGVLPEELKDIKFDKLWNHHPDHFNQIKIYDKMVDMPRYTQTYLKNYVYSGVEHQALPLPQDFKPFFDWANKLKPNETYNQVLVNWYKDGSHYIGAHTDNEKQLVKEYPIISISLGAERIFRIRNKETKEIVKDIVMKDRTYLIMGGKMQQNFTHEVPKITGKIGENTGKRINITFRKFK
jgi:alkylated DNA repair dioxygenase AlkB